MQAVMNRMFVGGMASGLLLSTSTVSASQINLKINYPDAALSPFEQWSNTNQLFGLNWFTCQEQYQTQGCPAGIGVYGEQGVQNSSWVGSVDKTAPNVYEKIIDLGEEWTGPVVLSIFASTLLDITAEGNFLFNASTLDCQGTLNQEWSGEMCDQHGVPWTIPIDSTDLTVNLEIFPAFGLGVYGETTTMLPNFATPSSLGGPRDIPVYVPPSVSQNTVKRKVNVLFFFDGSEVVVRDFARRTGFEAGQFQGTVPESIIIGIQTAQYAYAFNFAARSYELSYSDISQMNEQETCLVSDNGDGSFSGISPSGGSDELFDWMLDSVLPAVMATLDMEVGELTTFGGSMGGLTACYAAASRPESFSRAVCASPTNCLAYSSGGLAPIIKSQYASTGVRPKAVFQYQGIENYDEDPHQQLGDEFQLDYLVQDAAAWESIGMQPLTTLTDVTLADGTKAKFPMEQSAYASDSVTMTYFYIGGTHSPTTWQAEFAHALPHLYRASPPDRFRVPVTEFMRTMTVSTVATESGDGSDDAEDYSSQLHVIMGLAVACISLLLVNLCLLCVVCAKSSKKRQPTLLMPDQAKSESAL